MSLRCAGTAQPAARSARLSRRSRAAKFAISGAFARRFGLSTGDVLELATPRRPPAFRIAGQIFGMAGPNGIVFMDIATFDAHWPRAGASAGCSSSPLAIPRA